jgi:ATP-binding cassette subfamily F protein 3
MIHLSNIEKAYGPQLLFSELNWHIKNGQRIGLVGPNGAGKSTLVKIITGDVVADGGTTRIARGVTVGYLPQEVSSLAGKTVREEAREGLVRVLAVGVELEEMEAKLAQATAAEAERLMEAYGLLQALFERLGGFLLETRVEEVLSGLGFKADQFDQDCGTLSGGWQMRVALARLLLQAPDLLLLDEPTNHLDLESVVWLENFLQNFPGSLVFISHDRRFLDRLSSHIAELSTSGLRLYTGNFTKYVAQAAADHELLLRQAKNQARQVAQLERFISRFRAKATKAKQVQSRVKMLEKIDRVEVDSKRRTVQFKLPEPPKSGRVVMTLENVHKAYGDMHIYAGLDMELIRGRHIALVGPNGAGKSTLLKIMAGVLDFERGRRLLGFQARLYHFAQHQVEVLNPNNTVLAEVGGVVEGLSPTQLRSALGAFLFSGDDVEKRISVLSGGERNRTALVKMLLTPANVLLLDEPTNHLDMESRAVLEQALAEYSGTVVLISHDRQFIDGICDEVWEVQDGRITPFVGSYTEYLARIQRNDRPEPLPLHASERPRRGAKKAKPKQVEPEAPALDWAGGGDVSRRKSREERRLEAQARQRRSVAIKPLKKAVLEAEALVAKLESRLEKLHAEQADPAHYQKPERVQVVARRVHDTDGALSAAYADWEAKAAQLEVLEAEM